MNYILDPETGEIVNSALGFAIGEDVVFIGGGPGCRVKNGEPGEVICFRENGPFTVGVRFPNCKGNYSTLDGIDPDMSSLFCKPENLSSVAVLPVLEGLEDFLS